MGQRKIHRLGFHSQPHVCGFLPPSVVIGTYQEGLRNMLRIGSITSTPLSLLPTSLCQLRSRHWAPSTVRVASSCWNLVVVELGCLTMMTIQERLFSCFNDCQYASSALTPSLIEAPSHRAPRMMKSLLDYITVISLLTFLFVSC